MLCNIYGWGSVIVSNCGFCLIASTVIFLEFVACIFQEYMSSRYICSSNEMDLSYVFSVLKELEKCCGIWEQRTVLQSVELPLMSARDRLLPCSHHEVTSPVVLVGRVTLPWMKVWSVSEMCSRHNTPTDNNLLACHIKFV